MYFSSLLAFASALTFSYRSGSAMTNPTAFDNVFSLDVTAYGGNILEYYNNGDMLSLDDWSGDTITLLSFNVSSTTISFIDGQEVSVDTTLVDYVYFNYQFVDMSENDEDSILRINCFSPRGNQVSPSLFFWLALYDTGSLTPSTPLYTGYTRVVSSVDDGFVWTYELSVDTSQRHDYQLDFAPILVYTNYTPPVHSDDYLNGYDDGFENGYDNGYAEGNFDGYGNGYDVGYDNGYHSGNNDGYHHGYTEGYDTALSTHDFTFTNLFGSLADTPVLIIRRLFGFELFGVSLISVFMSLFTALIVIHLVKKVF